MTSHTPLSDVRCDVAVGLAGGRVVVADPPGVSAGGAADVSADGSADGSVGFAAGAPAGAVRIEIDGPGAGAAAATHADARARAVAARPGVVAAREDGRVVVVTREEADAVLLWMLQHGCSVVSVQPDAGPAGAGGQ